MHFSSQIAEEAKLLYAGELPRKLLVSIDEQLCQGKLKPQTAMKKSMELYRILNHEGQNGLKGGG